jgi:autotransporter passenger strand-loop-strand repeat protein
VLGAQVKAGGNELVVSLGGAASGGLASGTVVSGAGANLTVGFGATVSGTTVSAGGVEVLLFGTAVSTTVNNGGIEVISLGAPPGAGVASATTVNSGGQQFVEGGGLASGTVVMSGGAEFVFTNGQADHTTISGGGFVDVKSGGLTNGSLFSFASGNVIPGALELDDSVHFGGLVAGFGMPDFLDLRDIPFTSGVTSLSYASGNVGNTSGTLTVTSGGLSANLTLLGQYVAGNFNIQTDGAGGTLVTDPPVSASAQNQLALANTYHA